MTTKPDILKDPWVYRTSSAGGGRFAIPQNCVVCRAFDDLFNTVDMMGGVAAHRWRLVITFRHIHHNPLFAMVDRDEQMIKRLKKGGWPDRQLRDVARLVALVGPECGYTRPIETISDKR